MYVLSNLGSMRESVKNYTNVAFELASRVIYDNVPRYKEEEETS
jgi:hypothetical protein